MPSPVAIPAGIDFTSRFLAIDSSLADRIVMRFGSPVFLIDLPGLESRFCEFHAAVKSRYANSIVAISYKTNPTLGLLQCLHRQTSWAEVVSSEEFQLARHLAVPLDKIVFNGPGKGDLELQLAVQDGSQINCDHMDEILRIERIAASLQKPASIGIRLGLNLQGHFSRFGFALTMPLQDSEAMHAANYAHQSPHLSLAGIHSQLGTNIREMEKFREQATALASFARDLQSQQSIELQWINVGGGLAGIAPEKGEVTNSLSLPSVDDYSQAIVQPLLEYLHSCRVPPSLFFEPGRTIFEPFGGLLTTVLGRRPQRGQVSSTAICDAGVSSLSLANRFDFPVHHCVEREFDPKDVPGSWDLFGPTCMQRDHLGMLDQPAELKIGDRLIFCRVGGYGLSTASSFIKYRPGVVAWQENDKFDWLRKPETLEHQLMLQSPPSA